MSTNVVYVTNARLPTEKAHGFAIAKMCEALSKLVGEVELWYPRQGRGQVLREANVFSYYGVSRDFSVSYLPTLALERYKRLFPFGTFMVVSLVRGLVRSFWAAGRARRSGADLFWTRDPTMMFCLVLMGVPTLYEAHSIPARARKLLIRVIGRRSALRGVITLTQSLKQELGSLGMPLAKIVAFPNAVDVELYKDLPDRDEARRHLGLPLDRQIVGYIGRFVTSRRIEKGVPDVIEAMAEVSRAIGGDPLLLCVGGPMDVVNGYEALAADRGMSPGSLRFVDRVAPSEVPRWIRTCDVCVIPWWEKPATESPAPPLKLFEYMAAGAAIVAGDLSEITDFLHQGETGLVVPRRSVSEMARAIGQLLKDAHLRDSLGDSAAAAARDFTWEKRAEAGLRVASIPLT